MARGRARAPTSSSPRSGPSASATSSAIPLWSTTRTGLGAGVRGDAAQINEARRVAGQPEVTVGAFRGSAAPYDPDGEMVPGRLNKDFFANMKAQAWWSLRQRFERTYRAVVRGIEVDPDEIISISPDLLELAQLLAELSQPTYSINGSGKVLVDKKPDGAQSPNLSDAVMIAYNPAAAAVWAHMWERLASERAGRGAGCGLNGNESWQSQTLADFGLCDRDQDTQRQPDAFVERVLFCLGPDRFIPDGGYGVVRTASTF